MKIESDPKPVSTNEQESRHFEFLPITYADLPENIRQELKIRHPRFKEALDTNEEVPGFELYTRAQHANGDTTYTGECKKVYSIPSIGENGEAETVAEEKQNTYFFDLRGEELTGYSELVLITTDTDEIFKDKPYVGFTKANDKFVRQGLATRRLYMMDAYARQQYGHGIWSDIQLSIAADELWKKLVNEGKAEKLLVEGQDQYRLI